MGIIKKLRSNMAANVIGAIVLTLTILVVVVCFISLVSFTRVYKETYAISTYHIADTATTLVNGDHLADYRAGERMEEYQNTKRYLNGYCKRMAVSIVYVIQVDQTDYNHFYSVFNLVNNSVDNTEYTSWELGHWRQTTNDEYRDKYIALYTKADP